jgi:hypothetical protein
MDEMKGFHLLKVAYPRNIAKKKGKYFECLNPQSRFIA